MQSEACQSRRMSVHDECSHGLNEVRASHDAARANGNPPAVTECQRFAQARVMQPLSSAPLESQRPWSVVTWSLGENSDTGTRWQYWQRETLASQSASLLFFFFYNEYELFACLA